MLKNLFIEFDKLCLVSKCFKIYTIGDCYVAIGFNDFENKERSSATIASEARNLVEFAFCLIEIIENIRLVINY